MAIFDTGIAKQTLYEIEKSQFTRSTYERAMESLDAVNGEIQDLIRQAWHRRPAAEGRSRWHARTCFRG